MEKYSKFKDPLTGINPFLQPKPKPITMAVFFLAIIRFPIYILFLCGLPVVGMLIRINRKDNISPSGFIVCNSASEFDKEIIKKAFGIKQFGHFKHKTCVCFPEKTNSNNTAILSFKEPGYCDYSIGLKYSSECIYMYGNRFLWFVRFLGSFNTVDVRVTKGSSLEMATSLPKVMLGFTDKERFLTLIKQK
ncbi:uncharacterized protein VICG_01643 [Vittaforma corneae ATCC 50505]|uniref:Uncharacterized protein n=1 Tax=Vittaforma corneae (strain ATCC 50505) TaxID=993615 RepID=L2GL86_VITCO|nr:uncharacterized protein VICG_01643 [Vittaforma corneae ATCC 50505]ELA41270.1 hypothetical protein VICG_01643 [Vittaforma corneae ATCC 50505]